jgi:hypothetical protein
MRRSMSDRVGKEGRAISPNRLDFMICLRARFELESKVIGRLAFWPEGGMTQEQMSVPGPGTAFYERRNVVSI